MNVLFGAALAGLATFLFSIPSYLRAKTDEHSPFWRPSGKSASKKLARRASVALSRGGFLYAWILFVPSLLMLTVLLALGSDINSGTTSLGNGLGFVAGAGLGFGLTYVLGLRKAIRQGLLMVATQAGKAIARRGALEDAEHILVRATQKPQQHLRLAAAISLRYLATTAGNAALEKLTIDSDNDVRNAAKSSLENIHAVLNGERMESVKILENVAQEFQALEAELDILVDGTQRAKLMSKYYHLTEVFESVIYAQLPLRRSYPYLFCMDCHCRSELQVFKDWAWVRCKRCKDVFGLKPAIVTVAGQIGGVDGWELRNGELKLSLWNAAERKAMGAEIDVLEIVGQREISYDWAVNAVVEQLRAYATNGECHVPIQLINEPSLDSNTLKLLRLVDRSVAVGD